MSIQEIFNIFVFHLRHFYNVINMKFAKQSYFRSFTYSAAANHTAEDEHRDETEIFRQIWLCLFAYLRA